MIISALKITADNTALCGVASFIILSACNCGYVIEKAAGMMAKYLATSLAMLNVVSAPRVIKSCLPTSTTSISLVGLESRSTMLAASLAACVPVFIATPTSACASAGASLVPSPVIATMRPPACCSLISFIFVSGVACARKSSTPAFFSDGGGGERVIPCNHNGANAHAPQLVKASTHTTLDNILEFDDAQHASALRHSIRAALRLSHHQRGATGAGNAIDDGFQLIARRPAMFDNVSGHRIGCPFADRVYGSHAIPGVSTVEVYAAHARHGRKRDEISRRVHLVGKAVLLPGQRHNRASLRCLIGKAGKHGRPRQVALIHPM